MIFSSHLILSNVSHLEPTNCFNNSLLGKKRNFVPRTLWILIWFISSSVSSVQSLSYVLLFATPWTAAGQASLSIANSLSLLKLMSIESVVSSNHLILCHPLLLLPSIFPSSASFPMSQFSSGGQEKQWIHVSVQFSSVIQSCLTLCDPMNHSIQGLPVHHQLPEFTQTQVYRVSDAIQPSHPLSSPSPPAPNPSQHQSLFQWVNSSHVSRLGGCEQLHVAGQACQVG